MDPCLGVADFCSIHAGLRYVVNRRRPRRNPKAIYDLAGRGAQQRRDLSIELGDVLLECLQALEITAEAPSPSLGVGARWQQGPPALRPIGGDGVGQTSRRARLERTHRGRSPGEGRRAGQHRQSGRRVKRQGAAMTGGRRETGAERVELLVQALAQRAAGVHEPAPVAHGTLQRLDRGGQQELVAYQLKPKLKRRQPESVPFRNGTQRMGDAVGEAGGDDSFHASNTLGFDRRECSSHG